MQTEALRINRDTRVYLSVSANPSNFGTTVYRHLFAAFGMNAVYIPRRAPTDPLQLLASIRTLEIAGCSVSMPLKSAVAPFLDELDEIAQQTRAVNTIKNEAGRLVGFNADAQGMIACLEEIKPQTVLIYGSGAVASTAVYACRKIGVSRISLTARDASKAQAKSKELRIDYAGTSEAVLRSGSIYGLLVNVTPASMDPAPNDLSALVPQAEALFDVVLSQTPTPLCALATSRGLQVKNGVDMYRAQVQRQFEIYTGLKPTDQQIQDALLGLI